MSYRDSPAWKRGRAQAAEDRRRGIEEITALLAGEQAKPEKDRKPATVAAARHAIDRLTAIELEDTNP